MIVRFIFIALVCIACGVKGAPRPVQASTPAPVTVPGQALPPASAPVEVTR